MTNRQRAMAMFFLDYTILGGIFKCAGILYNINNAKLMKWAHEYLKSILDGEQEQTAEDVVNFLSSHIDVSQLTTYLILVISKDNSKQPMWCLGENVGGDWVIQYSQVTKLTSLGPDEIEIQRYVEEEN